MADSSSKYEQSHRHSNILNLGINLFLWIDKNTCSTSVGMSLFKWRLFNWLHTFENNYKCLKLLNFDVQYGAILTDNKTSCFKKWKTGMTEK